MVMTSKRRITPPPEEGEGGMEDGEEQGAGTAIGRGKTNLCGSGSSGCRKKGAHLTLSGGGGGLRAKRITLAEFEKVEKAAKEKDEERMKSGNGVFVPKVPFGGVDMDKSVDCGKSRISQSVSRLDSQKQMCMNSEEAYPCHIMGSDFGVPFVSFAREMNLLLKDHDKTLPWEEEEQEEKRGLGKSEDESVKSNTQTQQDSEIGQENNIIKRYSGRKSLSSAMFQEEDPGNSPSAGAAAARFANSSSISSSEYFDRPEKSDNADYLGGFLNGVSESLLGLSWNRPSFSSAADISATRSVTAKAEDEPDVNLAFERHLGTYFY
eukprot:Nk52_evm4s357 gene=Nk52_evmTU4s357